jgi:dephospho-CoA kinase
VERIFGITGGVGMGKSTLGDLLAQRGVAVVDTDKIARQIVEPGQPALAEIVQRFGPSILRPDQTLNREALALRVFGDDPARADLEAILHPRIRAIWTAEVERWRDSSPAPENAPRTARAATSFGAVIIPLLFETNSSALFDAALKPRRRSV